MNNLRKWLWLVIVLLVAISIGLVARRILILCNVIAAMPAGSRFAVETTLKNYPLLTLLHIIPGLLFVLLGPVLLRSDKIAVTNGKFRWLAFVYIAAAAFIGVSAIVMPFIAMPIGGIHEASAAVLFGCIFLLETTQLLRAILRNNKNACHDWLLRTLALGLAIATTRPVMVSAFILAKLRPEQFLGTAFWLSFTIHLCVAELWIHYRSSALAKAGE